MGEEDIQTRNNERFEHKINFIYIEEDISAFFQGPESISGGIPSYFPNISSDFPKSHQQGEVGGDTQISGLHTPPAEIFSKSHLLHLPRVILKFSQNFSINSKWNTGTEFVEEMVQEFQFPVLKCLKLCISAKVAQRRMMQLVHGLTQLEVLDVNTYQARSTDQIVELCKVLKNLKYVNVATAPFPSFKSDKFKRMFMMYCEM